MQQGEITMLGSDVFTVNKKSINHSKERLAFIIEYIGA